jgi:hypothetical protein
MLAVSVYGLMTSVFIYVKGVGIMSKSLNGLWNSRKFWLAIFGVFQSCFFYYVSNFPDEIWKSVDVLVMVLILSIAIEDAGEKIGNRSE